MSPSQIQDFDALQRFLQKLGETSPYWACRGEHREFPEMKPRIERCAPPKDKLADRLYRERAVIQRFREHAPNYLSVAERPFLETQWLQLVLMQHYGAPTRLLDWTKSAWVAAFFSVCDKLEEDGECENGKNDGFIYVFRRDVLEDRIRDRICTAESLLKEAQPGCGTKKAPELAAGRHWGERVFNDEVWARACDNSMLLSAEQCQAIEKMETWVATYYCREAHFPRLVAQQGLFTFANKPNVDHWKVICKILEDPSFFHVARIPVKQKLNILRNLNNMGLNAASLFPGLDGIGRSLDAFARGWQLQREPAQTCLTPPAAG